MSTELGAVSRPVCVLTRRAEEPPAFVVQEEHGLWDRDEGRTQARLQWRARRREQGDRPV